MAASAKLAPDLETWPTIEAAALALNCSERTVYRRYIDEHKIEVRQRQRPGKRPETVCNPADVERLAMPAPHVMPEEEPANARTLHGTLQRPQSAVGHPWTNALETIAAFLQNRAIADGGKIAGTIDRTPLWLTLEQAAEATQLPRTLLYEACRAGKLVAVCRNQWLIKRSSLEAFEG